MGIVRSRLHKRKTSGGKTKIHRKRRVHELGRLPGNTKLGNRRVTSVRARGGNYKVRALRLDTGNFAWSTYAISQRARILDVVYNATSNELVRTKALVKNCIVSVDAAPFKLWYTKHFGIELDASKGKKKGAQKVQKSKKAATGAAKFNVNKASAALKRKWTFRQKSLKIEKAIEDQLKLGRVLAKLTSRPGQSGRADGALLEGAELQFYTRKLEKKKGK
ncbi:40S ribosomal protein S8, putative [Bodo saltans]|uniref:40S ribosomal protein S8 n=1 Tax=Bodo saltans TaxID=75058 RepID=A0A0S4IUG1_BODSA|nr:40S ribosomal protein S8, putative [Bodo saltans]|eukprot:CUG10349.1 40S ribosomal protein S8, putative [Bodo saltans]